MKLQNDPRIGPEGVEYISKAQAFKEMKQKEPDIVAGVATNPLPDAFRIKPKHGEDVVAIANSLNPLAGRRGKGQLRQEDGEADPARGAHLRGAVRARDRDPADRGDDPDREHDPALDLRAAA